MKMESGMPNLSASQPSSSSCAKCAGVGYVFDKERGVARECDCAPERRVAYRLPPLYRQARLKDFPAALIEQAVKWTENPGLGLLITGKTGTGKTHLAAALVRFLTLSRKDACFLPCEELYAQIRRCYSANGDEDLVMREHFTRQFLFLDDLGAGSLSDHERRVTLRVLNQRQSNALPICVTTNWSLEQIAERMDERIAGRLQSLTAIELAGPDRRAK